MAGERRREPVKVLTIAGSDSGGAAGLQADLKTFAALGVYGICAITVVTAQNSLRVAGVHPIPADFIADQINAVLTDYGTAAAKTGFIGRPDAIELIADRLDTFKKTASSPCPVVVDPVLVNHEGQSLFPPAVTQAYLEHLLPLTFVITPNKAEARLLSGQDVKTLREMETAAQTIHARGPEWVLIKGGREGTEMVDLLYDGQETYEFRAPFIPSPNTHGSGDTLSAAICAYLAKGSPAIEAVELAHQFTQKAIRGATEWRLGGGHGPVSHWQNP